MEGDFNAQQGVNVRPCPSCGGEFEFDIDVQKLVCPHCGAEEDIVHAEGAAVEEQGYDGVAFQQQERPALEGEKEAVCQNCGGHTTFIGTTTATRCPYCATPMQRSDVHQAPDRLAVDGVLPFTVSSDGSQELLEKWVNKRWFAPNEFKKYSTAGSFESVYAAYFTYDAQATTDYVGERGNTRTVTTGSGNNRRTRVETNWYPARGRVFNSFDDITILGNTGFQRKYVDKLEPWPTSQLQPYHSDYIAGHLCRTYDRDVTDCFGDARYRMNQEIERTVRRDIGGDKQRIHNMNTHLAGVTYKHVLLPIWLLTVIYEGQPWQVFMNGVTGEIHGQRPWSKAKIASAVVTVMIIVAFLVLVARLANLSSQ